MTGTKGTGHRIGLIVVMALIVVITLYNALFSFSYSVGENYRNVSVDTRVNITDAKPEILTVVVDSPITLVAGSTKLVACNASIRDWNGGDTITNVSATYYDRNVVGQSSPNDNNNHYTNLTCGATNVDGYYANFTCYFTVWYFANNGTDWVCNVTVTDMNYTFNSSVNGSNVSMYNTSTIQQLLALNVTPLIDYGNMAVGDTSVAIPANVTNFGNYNINISVKGYGSTPNDGLSFVCDVGNISIGSEKYDMDELDDYTTDYTELTSSFVQITGLMIPQQTNDAVAEYNTTYWKLYVPPNPFGECNGTIVFQAETATN